MARSGTKRPGHWGTTKGRSVGTGPNRTLAEYAADEQSRDTRTRLTVKGRVSRLFFSNGDFTAGKVIDEDGAEFAFAGKCCVSEGDAVVLSGVWGPSKYGMQLQVESVRYDLDLDEAGLTNWLATNPEIRDIGPKRAARIAALYWENFDEALETAPGEVAARTDTPLAAVLHLAEVWKRNRQHNAVASRLAAYELTYKQIRQLIERYGDNVLGVLSLDPYMLIRTLRGFGFKKVDIIARKLGTPKGHEGRIKAALIYLTEEATRQGHTWVAWKDLIFEALRLLALDDLDAEDRITEALNALLTQDEELALVDLPGGGPGVALSALKEQEEWLAACLVSLMGAQNPLAVPVPDDLDFGPDREGKRPTAEQRDAVKRACRHGLSLVTGGAGTGKTYTVNRLVDWYESHGFTVALAAPTGKAARRMEEMCGRPAQTIHRLLGLRVRPEGTYTEQGYGEKNVVEADLLVVDEVSMVDVPLFHALLSAVDFRRTAVVLVGDPNQLPPVGPGNVLRDLLQGELCEATRLSVVKRQSGGLKDRCRAVLDGKVPGPMEPAADGYRPWNVLTPTDDPEALRGMLLDMHRKILLDKLGFDLLSGVQVLSPQKKGPLGTDALNRDLQVVLQLKLYGRRVERCPDDKTPTLHVGDKVIQTKNNYDLDVMNGSIGVVVDETFEGKGGAKRYLSVRFEEGETILYPPDLQKELALAYALTIHKAQGSEFPCVVVVCHKSHHYMHHRNLLYTAVTRGRKCVLLLGDPQGVKMCAKKVQVDTRRTLLPHFAAKLC